MSEQTYKSKTILVALMGNPNTGKSTIFNSLTGSAQYVGNWPGVTVEKKEGTFNFDGYLVKVVDLPGTYNLTAISIDELIARNFILEERPDIVLQVVDASKLERNLYLLLELLELGVKIVVALNMYDLAKAKGIELDVNKLEEIFGVKFVPTVGDKRIGLDDLKVAIIRTVREDCKTTLKLDYGEEIENYIKKLADMLKVNEFHVNKRWLAVKLLEGDPDVIDYVKNLDNGEEIIELLEKINLEILEKHGKPANLIILNKRYDFIKKVVETVAKKIETEKLDLSDLIDKIVTHPVWGIPIFIIVIYSMFKFTFDVAQPFVDLTALTFSILGDIAERIIPLPILRSFIVNGVIEGVGTVLLFLPNIAFLFLFMSFLEDIGYMSRVAFNFDNLMRKLGLSGKSIIPLLLAMGCNVPAIMSTRTIEDEYDRKITILVSPLIPCSARFPVFIMLASIFFSQYAAIAVLSMYLLGFILASIIATIVRKYIYKSKEASFIIELPEYKIPSLNLVFKQSKMRIKHFLEKVSNVILIMSMIIWALLYLPYGAPIDQTYGAIIGKTIQPVLSPLGYTWEITLALIFGFVAKEIIISSLAIIFSGQNLAVALSSILTPVSAYSLMAFVLIYTPCMPTIATIRSETGDSKLTAKVILYELILAYAVALLINTVGVFILGVI